MNIDIRPLENMTDDEIRQYMAKENGIFVTGREIGKMRAMFSIKKSIKKLTMHILKTSIFGGIV